MFVFGFVFYSSVMYVYAKVDEKITASHTYCMTRWRSGGWMMTLNYHMTVGIKMQSRKLFCISMNVIMKKRTVDVDISRKQTSRKMVMRSAVQLILFTFPVSSITLSHFLLICFCTNVLKLGGQWIHYILGIAPGGIPALIL